MASFGCALDRRLKEVVPTELEAFDDCELDQLAFGATSCQNRDEVDGLCDQRPRHGDDRFLDELLEPPQRADGGAGVDRADPTRMASPPGLQEIQRLGAADFTYRDAIGPKPQ